MSKPRGLFIVEPHIFELVFDPQDRARLHDFVDFPDRSYTPAELLADPSPLKNVEFLFSSWCPLKLDAKFLDTVPNLRAFFFAAGTLKYLVTDEFWARNIPIISVAAANAIPVAEFTFAQIILSLKRFWWFSSQTRLNKTYPDRYSQEVAAAGCYTSTVGLVSLGLIGRLVLEKLRTLESKVIVYDPYITSAQATELGIELVSLPELFRRSDVVSLHTPWLKETEGLITRELILSMKPNTALINTSRGMVVDEEGMIQALRKRPDLYALLDVVRQEPPPADSPLYTLPNVLLTPHIAGSVNTECWRMGKMAIDEAIRFAKGEPLQLQVTKEQEARRA